MDLNRAREIVSDLMELHLSDQWSAAYDSHVKRAGVCRYRTRTLTFSLKIAAAVTEAEFTDTVVHEIAHALTPGHNHDGVWKRNARALGGTGNVYSSTVLDDSEYAWIGKCAEGVHKVRYLRKPGATTLGSTFTKCTHENGKIYWFHNGVAQNFATPTTAYLSVESTTTPAATAFPVERSRGPYDRGFTDSADIWG